MMFSIQQIYLKSLQNGTITVVTPDADIFVVLLYHLKNNWQGLINMYILKKRHIKVAKTTQKELYSFHLLIPKLDAKVIDNLQAGHNLTAQDVIQ